MEAPRSVVARGGGEKPAPVIQPGSSLHTLSGAKELPDVQLPSNQSYNSIVSSGNSRLHAGNVYNNHYHLTPSIPETEERNDEQKRLPRTLLRYLNFKEASLRHTGIATAHPDTCRWVVDCPQYKRWRNPDMVAEHHGCLWIKGKPGAGKSTIMKGLLRHAKEAYPNDKVVSFFFNARGTLLERSTEGMYRSILHQMASTAPSLLADLDPETMEFYAKQGWPLELLKDLCREAVRSLTEETGITVFIDALDEGDLEDDVRDMVAFMEELTTSISLASRNLHVCLASRHYPAISMQNVERLVLDSLEDHDDDITTFVRAQLRIRNATMRAELVSSICNKASGVFLWVVLVVKILNKEADRGNQHDIPAKLKKIPNDLHHLFETIIERNTEDNRYLLPALLWVLFSEGSLKPIELYFAIMFSTGQMGPGSMICDPSSIDSTMVEDFLISSSKGLVECAHSGYAAHRSSHVQIIHESVREYLLTDGLCKLDEGLSIKLEAKCHWRLAKWSMTYIRLAVEHGLLDETEQARSYRQCPLLEYATEYAFSHAEKAAQLGHRQIVHDAAPIETWRHFGRQHSESTMLNLLVQESWYHLVDLELERNSKQPAKDRQTYLDTQCLGGRSGNDLDCTALDFALAVGSIGMVRALLESGADPNVECKRHGVPLEIAAMGDELITKSERSQIVELLLENGADAARLIDDESLWVIGNLYERFGVLEVLVKHGVILSDAHPQLLRAVKDKDWGFFDSWARPQRADDSDGESDGDSASDQDGDTDADSDVSGS